MYQKNIKKYSFPLNYFFNEFPLNAETISSFSLNYEKERRKSKENEDENHSLLILLSE